MISFMICMMMMMEALSSRLKEKLNARLSDARKAHLLLHKDVIKGNEAEISVQCQKLELGLNRRSHLEIPERFLGDTFC